MDYASTAGKSSQDDISIDSASLTSQSLVPRSSTKSGGAIAVAPIMPDLLLFRKAAQTIATNFPTMKAEGRVAEYRTACKL